MVSIWPPAGVFEIHREITLLGDNQEVYFSRKSETIGVQPQVELPLSRGQIIPAQTSTLFQRIQAKLRLRAALHFERHFPLDGHHGVIKNDPRTVLKLLQVVDAQWQQFGGTHQWASCLA